MNDPELNDLAKITLVLSALIIMGIVIGMIYSYIAFTTNAKVCLASGYAYIQSGTDPGDWECVRPE